MTYSRPLSLLNRVLLKYNLLPSYNKDSDFISYVWLLSSFMSHHFPFVFCPTFGWADPNARIFFPLGSRSSNQSSPNPHAWAHIPPTSHKKLQMYFLYSVRSFSLACVGPALFSQERFLMSMMNCFMASWYVWVASSASNSRVILGEGPALFLYLFSSPPLYKTSLYPWDETSKRVS